VSERLVEAMAELHELLHDLWRSSEDTGYGYFPGGDPNDFTPDPECSTDEERARHKEACESWSSGKGNPNPALHCGLGFQRVPPPGFGMGTYVMRDEQAADWADRLERCINRLESE